MPVERHLLFAVLAFEDELIDLQQLTSACRAWASDKSKPLADLLVERGWISAEDRTFLDRKSERKLAKHQNDPQATLNMVTRGDICDVLRKEVDDTDVQQTLGAWPSTAPVLVETLIDSGQSPTRYTWISQVGSGGLGQVWLAKDNNLSREVAVKEVKPDSISDEAVRRLIKEAQITGQLQHPGIVPVYEVNYEGRPFYTMKLVKGETFSDAIGEYHAEKRAGKTDLIAERRLISIFLNVCDAIAYAHSRGVIHRDLKPENIVLGDYGEAVVLDWGLARQVGTEEEEAAPVVVSAEGRTDATQAGQKMGTPAYMSPEQAAGRVNHMDERTDIYGLGAILFEILTGEAPHQTEMPEQSAGESSTRVDSSTQSPIVAMLHRIATEDARQARSVDDTIPEELDRICATALARRRDERYQTAKELKAALLQFQVHEESIDLAARAAADLKNAVKAQSYDDFSRARFGFEQAVAMWPDNHHAIDGKSKVCFEFARCAQSRGDLDLGMSLLDRDQPQHRLLYDELLDTRNTILARERQLEEQKAARAGLRRIITVGTVTALILMSGLVGWAYVEREEAIKQEQIATANAEEATRQEEQANEQKLIAEVNEEKAVIARNDALIAQKKEAEQRLLAEKSKDAALLAQKKEAEQRLIAQASEKQAVANAAEAQRQKRIADNRFDLASQAVSDMLLEVGAEALDNVPQMEGVRAVLLDKALLLYEKIAATSDSSNPEVRFQTGLANFQIGEIHRLLGTGVAPEKSEIAYNAAINQFRQLSDDFPNEVRYRQQMARSYMWLGELLRESGDNARIAEAEQHYDSAITIQTALAAEATNEGRIQYQIDLGRSHMNRGIVRKNKREWNRSIQDYNTAERLLMQISAAPDRSSAQLNEALLLLAKCHLNRGVLFRERYLAEKNPEFLNDATAAFREAIAILTAAPGNGRTPGLHAPMHDGLELARYRNNLAVALLTNLGQLDDEQKLQHLKSASQEINAAVSFGEALNVGTREVRIELANFYNTRAFVASRRQDGKSLAEWEKAADVLKTVWTQNNDDAVATEKLAMVQCNICDHYLKQDEYDKAITAIEVLTKLSCEKPRYQRAAELMQIGKEKIRSQDRTLAAKYQKLHALFESLAQGETAN